MRPTIRSPNTLAWSVGHSL